MSRARPIRARWNLTGGWSAAGLELDATAGPELAAVRGRRVRVAFQPDELDRLADTVAHAATFDAVDHRPPAADARAGRWLRAIANRLDRGAVDGPAAVVVNVARGARLVELADAARLVTDELDARHAADSTDDLDPLAGRLAELAGRLARTLADAVAELDA